MSAFALRYAHGNVLVGRREDRAALYRLAMTSYPYLPNGREVGAPAPPAAPRAHDRRRLLACGE